MSNSSVEQGESSCLCLQLGDDRHFEPGAAVKPASRSPSAARSRATPTSRPAGTNLVLDWSGNVEFEFMHKQNGPFPYHAELWDRNKVVSGSVTLSGSGSAPGCTMDIPAATYPLGHYLHGDRVELRCRSGRSRALPNRDQVPEPAIRPAARGHRHMSRRGSRGENSQLPHGRSEPGLHARGRGDGGGATRHLQRHLELQRRELRMELYRSASP